MALTSRSVAAAACAALLAFPAAGCFGGEGADQPAAEPTQTVPPLEREVQDAKRKARQLERALSRTYPSPKQP